jgi:hypothetical protein
VSHRVWPESTCRLAYPVPFARAAPSVRRFVGHLSGSSLRSAIEAYDTLIVNPRIELLGQGQAAILTDLIVHVLDLRLERQVAVPRSVPTPGCPSSSTRH